MSSSTTLVLVRHAAAQSTTNGIALLCGRHEVPLSSEGRREAGALRQRLAAEPPFDAIYSSPLRRARQTAEAAPAELLRSLRILKSLAEIDCGGVDGMPIDEVLERYPELWRTNEAQLDEEFAWPGGESYRQFRRRVVRAASAISRAHPGRRVLIVTHAGVVNQILGHIAGQSAARWESFRPRPASLTRVCWARSGPTLEVFDDCNHL